ncbi:MAG: IPT/TIG domain-containing protein, partial [Myxococcota bacterium]
RGATTGPIRLRVGTQGEAQSAQRLAIEARRQLFAMEPNSGFAGVEVTLRGEGFPRSGARVEFGGRTVAARRISPAELRFIVPRRAQTGPVRVLLPNGRVLDAGTFVIRDAPVGLAVESVVPECVNPGCVAVLRGHGFGRQPRVRFEGQRVEVISATATEIRVRLPAQPGRGQFSVRSGRRQATSPAFMIVAATPRPGGGRRAPPAR